jgi:hypothetical protein
MLHTKEVLNTYMAAFCEQPVDKLRRDTDRDFYMTPQEARAYGLVDLKVSLTAHRAACLLMHIPRVAWGLETSLAVPNHACYVTLSFLLLMLLVCPAGASHLAAV